MYSSSIYPGEGGRVYSILNTYVGKNIRLAILAVLASAAFVVLCTCALGPSPTDILSSGVRAWWLCLCAVAVLNVFAWHRKALLVAGTYGTAHPLVGQFQRKQLLLAAVFVFGCGFRSVFPRADVQRITLIDCWLSSVLVGRSVATAAELCFMMQWALLLYACAREVRSPFGVTVSRLIVPLIAVAEVCSWSAVLTTCYLGNVLEESLWAVAAALLVLSCVVIWARSRDARRPFLAAALVLGTAYVAFMCAVDIPMYVSRWQADQADGRVYLAIGQGVADAWSRRVVTFSWTEWQTEIPWMTLYFSVCVWWSLALINAPMQVAASDSQPNVEPPRHR
jgi:hypothetical protein